MQMYRLFPFVTAASATFTTWTATISAKN